MENTEEIFHFLEDFSKRKPKTIPQELNEYLAYVARTGDPVYQWSLVKCLFKEKLLNVITDFYETSPGIDIPPYPNVDPFNYDTLKNSLIERLESFTSAPFTVQRICELLTYPRKQYNRVDKYMRAIEKNILVVSTREPGSHRHTDAENGEPIVNGSDNNSEYNVDVEMEDVSWKETKEQNQNPEPQPSSSESYSIAEIEARLRAKQGFLPASEEKPSETFASPQQLDQNLSKEKIPDQTANNFNSEAVPSTSDTQNVETVSEPGKTDEMDTNVKSKETVTEPMIVLEVKISDTVNKVIDDTKSIDTNKDDVKTEDKETSDEKCETEKTQIEDNISESESKDTDVDAKVVTEVSEVSSSSEESSSSSDNNDGNSNSPKVVGTVDDQAESMTIEENEPSKMETDKPEPEAISESVSEVLEKSPQVLQSENYSITDVNSELPQIPESDSNESKPKETVEDKIDEAPIEEKVAEEQKTETETEKKLDTTESAAPE